MRLNNLTTIKNTFQSRSIQKKRICRLGSAPIAAAAAQTEEPVAQGIISMLGTFIDTIIICTMTGLAIVIAFYTGTDAAGAGNLEGIALTSEAFSKVLGGDGRYITGKGGF